VVGDSPTPNPCSGESLHDAADGFGFTSSRRCVIMVVGGPTFSARFGVGSGVLIVGRANCYGVESIRTTATGVFKCDWAAACYSARGILVWDRYDSPGAGNVQREPFVVRSLESGRRSLRLACLPVGHMRDYCRRCWLRRARGLPLDSRSTPEVPVASANMACPHRFGLHAGYAFGFTSNRRCGIIVVGCSTFFRFVRGGAGCATL
jgi:hypothetical protein